MTNKTKINVQNRGFGSVGYTIPDLNNLHREFQPNEEKQITFEELFKLSQVPGGMYIIKNYFTIKNDEAVEYLLGEVEPEYFYTNEDIVHLMQYGSNDEFEDCLNFAPSGVIEVIKDLAVKLPLNDVAKRKMLFDKTGFNVEGALALLEDNEEEVVARPTRKAARPTVHGESGDVEPQPQKIVRKVVKPASSAE